jgi:hypothetical protein
LKRKNGDEEKGEVVYPSHFFENLSATAFGTICLPFQTAVHLKLAGLGTKYDEH